MSFLLKIVEGPNKGAEIALVEGVAVTLGKGDDCDIVLADATMPDEPLSLLATAGGVTAGGEPLEALHVRTFGATSFAVGPADASWGALVWPNAKGDEEAPGEDAETPKESPAGAAAAKGAAGDDGHGDSEPPREGERRRGGCCGCLAVAILLLAALAGLAWFFRDRLREAGKDSRVVERAVEVSKNVYSWVSERIDGGKTEAGQSADVRPLSISDVAATYGLSLSEDGGVAKVSGNLKTRRERLAAAAEAYQVLPGVDLDVTDDESLRTSVEDALFSLTEGAMKVSVATNRAVVITGHSRSAKALKCTLEALNDDVPKLRSVDVSGVVFSHLAAEPQIGKDGGEASAGPARSGTVHSAARKAGLHPLPVCGILTTPYPCLISRDGRRYLEGAEIGGGVILKIGADSVVLTNSTGRFTWKP